MRRASALPSWSFGHLCRPNRHFVEKGALLLEAEGTAAALHAGWKTAQTLMEWGIWRCDADARNRCGRTTRGSANCCCVYAEGSSFHTQLSFKAIIAGGAECHRLGLFDTIMLFDEHRPFLTKPNDLNAIITKLKEYAPERAIMVEVTSEADAFGAAEAMADVIQLEKFAPDMVARVVQGIKKRVDGRPVIAAAGGINAQNAGEYAKAGADTLVTSAPFMQSRSIFRFESTPCDSRPNCADMRTTDLRELPNAVAAEFSCTRTSHLQKFYDAMH